MLRTTMEPDLPKDEHRGIYHRADYDDYQRYADGVQVEHQGAAYFLKSLVDMGFHLRFSQEEDGIHCLATNNPKRKRYATVKGRPTRYEAMGEILSQIHNPGWDEVLRRNP